MKKSLSRLGKSLLASLLGVIFGFVGVELLLRITQPQPLYDPRLPYFSNLFVERAISLPGVGSPSKFTTNSIGLRGDTPPADWNDSYTVVAIGGSTTRCTVLDDTNTWPAQLQRTLQNGNLSVWVGNAGADGQSTRGHLLVMDTMIRKLHPDAVIVMAGINDMALSLYELSHTSTPFERFDNNAFYMQSAALRMISQLNEVRTARAIPLPTAHRSVQYNPITAEEETPLLRDSLKDTLPSLSEYRDNLNQIVDSAEEIGVEIVLITQATIYEDTDHWAGVDGTPSWIDNGKLRFSARTYARMLALFNAVTLDVCRQRKLRCIDLASQMPHNQRYFYDEIHFTDAGAEVVAELIAPIIEARMNTTSP